jgi:hypothetical protein
MKTLSPDTPPEIERILIEGYRKMTPAEKLRRVMEMHRFAEALALADIRRRHPNADERERRLRLASRWLDEETMRKVFGWDPRERGY